MDSRLEITLSESDCYASHTKNRTLWLSVARFLFFSGACPPWTKSLPKFIAFASWAAVLSMNLNLGNTSITALSHLACPIAWTYSSGLAVRGRNHTKKCANLMMWIGCCKAATKTTWFNLKPKPAPVEQRGFKVQVSQVLPWHTLERSQTFVDANDSWCSCSRRLRYWANFRRSLKSVTYRRKRTKNRRRWRRGRIGRPSKIRRQQVGWGTAVPARWWMAGWLRQKQI